MAPDEKAGLLGAAEVEPWLFVEACKEQHEGADLAAPEGIVTPIRPAVLLVAEHPRQLGDRTGAALLFAWDICVPALSWLLLAAALTITPNLRAIPIAVWSLPVLCSSLRFGRGVAALLAVATSKKLAVSHPHDSLDAAKTPCIYGFHPHGRYPMLIFPWLESRPDLFGKLSLAQSSLGKYVPTVGFVTSLCCVIDVARGAILKTLDQGRHVGLFPGGAREMVCCEPFSSSIPLVKHDGFLRLARARASKGEPTNVVPCFLFGLHDSYRNPLARLDALLFNATGVNLPLWMPTSANGGPFWMVCGAAIDPLEFSSNQDFADAYYTSLEALFDAHKGQLPAYAARSIEFVEVQHRSAHNEGSRDVWPHILATGVCLGFILVFSAAALLTHGLVRFSTLDLFERPSWPALAAHIVGTVGWTLASANLTIKGYHRWHRVVGYVGVAACVLMSGSAYHLSLEGCIGRARFEHSTFHAFSNMQIAGIVPLLLGYAIGAAKAGKHQEHQRYMANAHLLVVANFLPRGAHRRVCLKPVDLLTNGLLRTALLTHDCGPPRWQSPWCSSAASSPSFRGQPTSLSRVRCSGTCSSPRSPAPKCGRNSARSTLSWAPFPSVCSSLLPPPARA